MTKAVKKVTRYLKKPDGYMLIFQYSNHLEVVGYFDSDFTRCQDDLKSTLGYIFMLVGGVIVWKSAKQTLVASSTMQADFEACYRPTIQTVWLRTFISRLKVIDSISRLITIYYDNSAVVFFSKNKKSFSRFKHININYLVVRERVKEGQIKIEHINT